MKDINMNQQSLNKLIEAMQDVSRWKLENRDGYYSLFDKLAGCDVWYFPDSPYVLHEGVNIKCGDAARVLIKELQDLADKNIILELEKHYA